MWKQYGNIKITPVVQWGYCVQLRVNYDASVSAQNAAMENKTDDIRINVTLRRVRVTIHAMEKQ
jgi:hypothetical protein